MQISPHQFPPNRADAVKIATPNELRASALATCRGLLLDEAHGNDRPDRAQKTPKTPMMTARTIKNRIRLFIKDFP